MRNDLLVLLLSLLVSVPAARAEPEAGKAKLLSAYRQFERALGAPKDDPATAIAAFVVGCLAAHSGVMPPDDHFRAVVAQLRPRVQDTLAKIPASERRAAIERYGIIGMEMIVQRQALAARPDARAERGLRAEAAAHLGELQIDPDTLEVGPEGLRPRGGAPAAVASSRTRPTEAATPRKASFEVEPGRGLRASEIAGVIVYPTWDHTSWRGALLLKDGSFRSDLPELGAESFDARAERSAKPKLWGQWKREGGKYRLKFANEGWTGVSSDVIELRPGRRNERLAGNFTGGSSFSMGTTSSSRLWGIELDKRGRFRTSERGQMGSVSDNPEGVSAVSVQDDEGSATSISSQGGDGSSGHLGPSIGGGRAHGRRGSTEADRTGTYRIDGYTIELRYDSGVVVRRFFGASRTGIWYRGWTSPEKRD